MEIPGLRYDKDYYGPLSACIDWVAGGNFDGYVYRQRLRFSKDSDVVILYFDVVDDSRYDDTIKPSQVQGHYSATDHGTITCNIGDFRMRGKLVGKHHEILAFSSSSFDGKYSENVCFALQKPFLGWH